MNSLAHPVLERAQIAFEDAQKNSYSKRYEFMMCILEYLIELQDQIINTAHRETHLNKSDLLGEFDRACLQIKEYAAPLLSPDIFTKKDTKSQLMLKYRPIGPIMVFGASNFPLAYSTMGGDVAGALIAGNSVIYKAHPAHPETSLLVHSALKKAILHSNMPQDIYQHLVLKNHDYIADFIKHPLLGAVGFTGSQKIGRMLFDICQNRDIPIPFFGELGSINPVFVMPDYLTNHQAYFETEFIHSFTQRAGQQCTHPGILCLPYAQQSQNLCDHIEEKFSKAEPMKLLSHSIYDQFSKGYQRLNKKYSQIGTYNPLGNESIKPVLFQITSEQWHEDPLLKEEIFGAIGVVIMYHTQDELMDIAHSFKGQLTASIFGNNPELCDLMARKTGRIICNQMPTGVKISNAIHHGGPYPATTSAHFSAVGPQSVMRFLYPICYQNNI